MIQQNSKSYGGKTLEEIYREIQEVYLADNRPWIIGYSGGKDSTTVLQLVWNAISILNPDERKKLVYVISSDTLVENPVISKIIKENHININKAAKEQNLPITATILYPEISDTFWVNLIGKGYPAPSKGFRWCTERLKIRTSDKFILEKVSQFGEVILLLGLRKQESATRSQTIENYKIPGTILSRHSKFSQSFVYTPIVDFSKEDVWEYLLSNPSPWGSNIQKLHDLYRDGDFGDPDSIVDEESQPTGNTRFGCWVCTVVTKDKSLQALIDGGEEWLKPLRDFRNLLSETQKIENKQKYREYKRMNGKIKIKKETGKLIPGPYKFEYCKDFLQKVLQIQEQLRKFGPDPELTLINIHELHEIRRIWRTKKGDWEDSLPKIYREVTGVDLEWAEDDIGFFSNKESKILEKVCIEHEVPLQLVTKLLDVERQYQGLKRRSAIYSSLESVLGEEWRSITEIEKQVGVSLAQYTEEEN